MTGQGAYIFGCEGPSLSADEAAFFRDTNPWGFILFARNVEDPAQLQALTADLRNAVGRDAPVFIDQEGGRVARLTLPHWRDWLPPLEQVRQNKKGAVKAMYLRYRLISDELRAVGIDGNCAPVADIASVDTHPVLKNRCYGEDVVRVSEIAGTVAQALLDGGVLPVVKHMPGQGRASLDSHEELPRVSEKWKTLRWSDFMAFEPLAELPIAMTAHVIYEDLDPRHPATLSPEVIAMIRGELGFHGLLMTDDISMSALQGPLGQRGRAALDAGCDLVLHCSGKRDEMHEVALAAGTLQEAAQERADKALNWRAAPIPIDIRAAEAEFHALMTGDNSGSDVGQGRDQEQGQAEGD
ncbi:MAG: glycoside hydrolase family 3 protein [Rhodobacteraceae bacterium]|nr:glycoside hydrolase family 3 protein [Paracoccaceae bacterium]